MHLWISFVRLSVLIYFLRRQVNFYLLLKFIHLCIVYGLYPLFERVIVSFYFADTVVLWLLIQIPRKMMLQMYNLLHAMSRNDRDCDFYHRYGIFLLAELSFFGLLGGSDIMKPPMALLLFILSIIGWQSLCLFYVWLLTKDYEFKGSALFACFFIM